ncbi:MAG: hypothetical protein JSV79_09170 [Armatimonadota bacterium]|nr:MAG: hypothetical protein JSV79_09170 [Armatimonadota bacterium]
MILGKTASWCVRLALLSFCSSVVGYLVGAWYDSPLLAGVVGLLVLVGLFLVGWLKGVFEKPFVLKW